MALNIRISLGWVILLVAVSTRMLYFHHFSENPFYNFILPSTDSINFDQGALNFSEGDILAKSANNSYSPLYKYFIGIIYKVSGRNLPAVWLAQHLLGIATIYLVFLIGRKVFNEPSAFFGALIFNFFGPSLMYEGVMLRATLITFLGVSTLFALVHLKEGSGWTQWVPAGLTISLLVQSRPNVLMIFVVMAFIFLPEFKTLNLRQVKNIAMISALFCLPLLAQTYLIWGKFVLFDTSGPAAILLGNNPDYPGAGYWENFAYANSRAENLFSTAYIVLKRMLNQPLEMIGLYLRKAFYFFCSYEYPSNYNYDQFRAFSFLLNSVALNFAVISAFGMMGLLVAPRNSVNIKLLQSFAIGLMLSVVLVYPVGRFRAPASPFFALFAGYFVHTSYHWFRQKKFKLLLGALAFFIIWFFTFNVDPSRLHHNRINWARVLGQAYFYQERYEEALLPLQESLAKAPQNIPTLRILAISFFETGFLQKALDSYQTILKVNPHDAGAHFDSGVIYDRLGKGNEAMAHLKKARQLFSNQDDSDWEELAQEKLELLEKKYL